MSDKKDKEYGRLKDGCIFYVTISIGGRRLECLTLNDGLEFGEILLKGFS